MNEEVKKNGRKKPYTEIGISKIPCYRCGARAYHQWQICADDNLYRPLCIDCDMALNRLVLEWMGFTNVDSLITKYEKRNKGTVL